MSAICSTTARGAEQQWIDLDKLHIETLSWLSSGVSANRSASQFFGKRSKAAKQQNRCTVLPFYQKKRVVANGLASHIVGKH